MLQLLDVRESPGHVLGLLTSNYDEVVLVIHDKYRCVERLRESDAQEGGVEERKSSRLFGCEVPPRILTADLHQDSQSRVFNTIPPSF